MLETGGPVLMPWLHQVAAVLEVDYNVEGAAVGYKWFDRNHFDPLFPFAYGLSYSHFQLSNLAADVDDQGVRVRFAVKNTGDHAGKYVAQVYVSPVGDARALGWEAPRRLCGFRKMSLQRGESGEVSLRIEPQMLAVYDNAAKSWVIDAADYDFALSADSRHAVAHVEVHLTRRAL